MIKGEDPRCRSIQFESSIPPAMDVLVIWDYGCINIQRAELKFLFYFTANILKNYFLGIIINLFHFLKKIFHR